MKHFSVLITKLMKYSDYLSSKLTLPCGDGIENSVFLYFRSWQCYCGSGHSTDADYCLDFDVDLSFSSKLQEYDSDISDFQILSLSNFLSSMLTLFSCGHLMRSVT